MHASCHIVRLYPDSKGDRLINRYISDEAEGLGSFIHRLELARCRIENLPVRLLHDKRLFFSVFRISYVPFDEQTRRSLLDVRYLDRNCARDAAELRDLLDDLFLTGVRWAIEIYIRELLGIRHCWYP